jgi:hypothetical protein
MAIRVTIGGDNQQIKDITPKQPLKTLLHIYLSLCVYIVYDTLVLVDVKQNLKYI